MRKPAIRPIVKALARHRKIKLNTHRSELKIVRLPFPRASGSKNHPTPRPEHGYSSNGPSHDLNLEPQASKPVKDSLISPVTALSNGSKVYWSPSSHSWTAENWPSDDLNSSYHESIGDILHYIKAESTVHFRSPVRAYYAICIDVRRELLRFQEFNHEMTNLLKLIRGMFESFPRQIHTQSLFLAVRELEQLLLSVKLDLLFIQDSRHLTWLQRRNPNAFVYAVQRLKVLQLRRDAYIKRLYRVPSRFWEDKFNVANVGLGRGKANMHSILLYKGTRVASTPGIVVNHPAAYLTESIQTSIQYMRKRMIAPLERIRGISKALSADLDRHIVSDNMIIGRIKSSRLLAACHAKFLELLHDLTRLSSDLDVFLLFRAFGSARAVSKSEIEISQRFYHKFAPQFVEGTDKNSLPKNLVAGTSGRERDTASGNPQTSEIFSLVSTISDAASQHTLVPSFKAPLKKNANRAIHLDFATWDGRPYDVSQVHNEHNKQLQFLCRELDQWQVAQHRLYSKNEHFNMLDTFLPQHHRGTWNVMASYLSLRRLSSEIDIIVYLLKGFAHSKKQHAAGQALLYSTILCAQSVSNLINNVHDLRQIWETQARMVESPDFASYEYYKWKMFSVISAGARVHIESLKKERTRLKLETGLTIDSLPSGSFHAYRKLVLASIEYTSSNNTMDTSPHVFDAHKPVWLAEGLNWVLAAHHSKLRWCIKKLDIIAKRSRSSRRRVTIAISERCSLLSNAIIETAISGNTLRALRLFRISRFPGPRVYEEAESLRKVMLHLREKMKHDGIYFKNMEKSSLRARIKEDEKRFKKRGVMPLKTVSEQRQIAKRYRPLSRRSRRVK